MSKGSKHWRQRIGNSFSFYGTWGHISEPLALLWVCSQPREASGSHTVGLRSSACHFFSTSDRDFLQLVLFRRAQSGVGLCGVLDSASEGWRQCLMRMSSGVLDPGLPSACLSGQPGGCRRLQMEPGKCGAAQMCGSRGIKFSFLNYFHCYETKRSRSQDSQPKGCEH